MPKTRGDGEEQRPVKGGMVTGHRERKAESKHGKGSAVEPET